MLVKQTEKYFENHPSVNDGPISGPVRKFISCILQLDKVDFERAFIFKPDPLAESVEQWMTLMSACSNPIMSYLLCRKYLCVAHLAQTYLQPVLQQGLRQCLPFSWTTLRGKHCLHPTAVLWEV